MSNTETYLVVNYIRDLARHLALGTALDLDAIGDALESIQERTTALYAEYEKPPPAGAELIQEFMLEALQLIHQSVDEIFDFFDDGEQEHLTQAVLLVEEGDDVLTSIQYVIEQNQQEMSSATFG